MYAHLRHVERSSLILWSCHNKIKRRDRFAWETIKRVTIDIERPEVASGCVVYKTRSRPFPLLSWQSSENEAQIHIYIIAEPTLWLFSSHWSAILIDGRPHGVGICLLKGLGCWSIVIPSTCLTWIHTKVNRPFSVHFFLMRGRKFLDFSFGLNQTHNLWTFPQLPQDSIL